MRRKAIFLPGFGYKPAYYRTLISHLERTCDVLALPLAGPGASEKRDVTECIAEVRAQIKRWGADIVIGHSLGGHVALQLADVPGVRMVLALNPAMPVPYGVLGYTLRRLRITINTMSGRYGARASAFGAMSVLPYWLDMLRHLPSRTALTRSISRITYGAGNPLRARARNAACTIIWGNHDEFFDIRAQLAQLRQTFGTLSVRFLERRNHDWPVFPRAADLALIDAAMRERQRPLHR